MKKLVGKISVVILALLMVFSLGACGDKVVKVDTVGEALAGSTAAMLKQSGMTVDIDASFSTPAIGRVGTDVTAKIAKADKDYDFAVAGTIDIPLGAATVPMPLNMVKKGNILYSDGLTTGIATSYMESLDTTGLDEFVKEAVGSLDGGELKKGKKGYTVTFAEDYGAVLESVITTLNAVAPQKLGKFIEIMLGMDDGEIVNVVNRMFADGITVSGMITEADAVLAGLGDPSLTVGTIVDSFMLSAGVTAEDLKEMLGVEVPAEGKTPYGYLIAVFGDMPVDDLLSVTGGFDGDISGRDFAEDGEIEAPSGALTVAAIRQMLIEALGDDGMTVGDLWDIFAAKIDGFILPVLSYVADEQTLQMLDRNKPVLCAENLAVMTAGENSFSVTMELNGDLTVKKLSVVVKNDIKYNAKALVKIDVNVELGFSYGKVSVSAPSGELIAPCVLSAGVIDIAELPLNGDYVLEVYTGKGYTVAQPECKYYDNAAYDYVDIDGVSYSDGKITFTAAAVESIITQTMAGNDVYMVFTAAANNNPNAEPLEWNVDFVDELAYGI